LTKKEAQLFDYPKEGGSKPTRNVRKKITNQWSIINFHSCNN